MIGDILKSIFGDKNAKDKKLYWPYVELANAAHEHIKTLSDEQLRQKSREFQHLIREEKERLEHQLADLRTKAESLETSINEKEDLFDRIDKLEKEVDAQIEETLIKILPEAFAVVKETAYRWSTNGQLVVTAEEFDRD